MIRDVLLAIYGTVWAVVVIATAIRTGEVPAELWAVLGIGVGALLAAFRTDDRVAHRRGADGHTGDDPEED